LSDNLYILLSGCAAIFGPYLRTNNAFNVETRSSNAAGVTSQLSGELIHKNVATAGQAYLYNEIGVGGAPVDKLSRPHRVSTGFIQRFVE
jgi:hypothetical protein